MPDFGYLTDRDDSHGTTVCTPVSDLVDIAKLAFYGAKLFKALSEL